MSIKENKEIGRRAIEAINTGDFALLESLVEADGVDHAVPPGMPPTRDSAIQFLSMFRRAFPDLHYTVEDVIAEEDRVVQRSTARGTMEGEFLGMPATGKNATWSEMHIIRIKNGKIIEHWASVDQLGMLQQLGLAPAPGQTA